MPEWAEQQFANAMADATDPLQRVGLLLFRDQIIDRMASDMRRALMDLRPVEGHA